MKMIKSRNASVIQLSTYKWWQALLALVFLGFGIPLLVKYPSPTGDGSNFLFALFFAGMGAATLFGHSRLIIDARKKEFALWWVWIIKFHPVRYPWDDIKEVLVERRIIQRTRRQNGRPIKYDVETSLLYLMLKRDPGHIELEMNPNHEELLKAGQRIAEFCQKPLRNDPVASR